MTSMRAVLVAVVLLAMLAAGCVWSVPQPTLIREPRPDAVPLRIGVYYPSELRGFTYRHHLTDTTWVLGTPSMQLLTRWRTCERRPVGAGKRGCVTVPGRVISSSIVCKSPSFSGSVGSSAIR